MKHIIHSMQRSGTEGRASRMLLRTAPFYLGIAVLAVIVGWLSPTSLAQGENLVQNHDFSLGVDQNGVPVHWTLFGTTEVNQFEITDERASVGRFSLKFYDNDPNGSAGLRTHRVPAAPGDRFLVEVDVFVEQGTAMVYLDFHDAAGRRVDTTTFTQGVTSDWQTVRVEGTAPEGTDHVTIIVYVNIPNIGIAYFDNVRLYRL